MRTRVLKTILCLSLLGEGRFTPSRTIVSELWLPLQRQEGAV